MRDRATLHLTQLGGAAGGPEAICPSLQLNLAAMEGALAAYLASDDMQQPFDVVRAGWLDICVLITLLAHVIVAGCGGLQQQQRQEPCACAAT